MKIKLKKSRARTPPHPSNPDWSSAKFWGFIRSALRSAYNKWPPKWKVLHAAKREAIGKGKLKWEYQCKQCEDWFPGSKVAVDHIHPVGSLTTYDDLAGFTLRLFCSEDELQVLCDTCHAGKTKEENRVRREAKNEQQDS